MSENKKKIRLRLSNPNEIRKALSKISNMLINNEIEPKKANTIIYACNSILNSIRTDELEKQLQDMEELLNDK